MQRIKKNVRKKGRKEETNNQRKKTEERKEPTKTNKDKRNKE